MKLLLICDDKATVSRVNRHFTPGGYSLIHYSNPLKAMDNFKEISPDVVLFQENDFPRHWKLALQFLRESFSRENALFILLVDKDFSDEEAHKAHFLQVNGIHSLDKTMEELESTIQRYKTSPKIREKLHLLPMEQQKMNFMFMNPLTLQLINARVMELSEKGLAIKIDSSQEESLPEKDVILKNCSLNTGDNIIDLDAKVLQPHSIMVLEFQERTESQWHQEIQHTLDTLA